ncbi:bacteriohemerythrin [Spirochaeta cellobiosiphila]|uniref:bacteriohemerythrin n=1 Tax=Spirochaeta cellobiosiphila TaxID=504483 RepID=UPI00040AB96E|nr:bacteriohemerythrin [Spirochaeta cellobiosiphila]
MKNKQKLILSILIIEVISLGVALPLLGASHLALWALINAIPLICISIFYYVFLFRPMDKGTAPSGFKSSNKLFTKISQGSESYDSFRQDVRQATQQNYQVGEALSINTLSSLELVKDITGQIDLMEDGVKNLDENVTQNTQAVKDIFKAIQELASQLEQQSKSLESSSSAVEEMTSSSDNIARITKSRKDLTDSLVDLTRTGEQRLNETIRFVKDIAGQTGDILQMTSVINDLASRTNLLAINASIEAAHAGESGKGFGVVANEIRSLAINSAQNANNITEVLEDIADRIKNAEDSSSQTLNTFKEISDKTREVAAGLNEVSAGMEELVVGEREILNSTSELLNSSNTINSVSRDIKTQTGTIEQTMETLNQISHSTSSRFRQVVQSTEKLNNLFMQFSTYVSQNLINMDDLVRKYGRGKVLKGQGAVDIGIKWSTTLSVLNNIIDEQHQGLFDTLNKFLKGMLEGMTKDRLEKVISDLGDYVVKHFNDEEDFLKKNHYPDLQKHHEIHQQYIKRMNELIQEFRNDGASPSLAAKVQKDIGLGLIRHIYHVDMRYKEYFVEQGIFSDPH